MISAKTSQTDVLQIKADDSCFPPLGRSPWLVYADDVFRLFQTFCAIESDSNSSSSDNNNNTSCYYVKSIPQLRGKSICGCCHGWLILRDTVDHTIYSVWNPVSSECVCLPPLPVDPHTIDVFVDEACTLIISEVEDNDAKSDCISSYVSVVLLFFGNSVFSSRPSSNRKSGDSGWVEHSVEVDGERLDVCDVISVNKIVYGWATTEEFYTSLLFIMEVADDASNSLTVKSLRMEWPRSGIGCVLSAGYWVESCGHIYYVSVYFRHGDGNRISRVKVLELDLVGRNWVEVKSLEGRAFFLGKDCSTWCWGSDTTASDDNSFESSHTGGGGGGGSGCVRGDCVYFYIPEMDDAIYYCYSLNEGAVSVFLSCPKLQSSSSSPIWLNMMPRHYRSLGGLVSRRQELAQTNGNVDEEGLHRGMIRCSLKCEEHLPQEKERQGEESLLFSELPQHLIHLISEYMHLFDFWNFRASCKAFQSAVSPLPLCRTNDMLPLFISLTNDGKFCEILDPCRGDTCFSAFQLSSDPFAIDFSKDGWLVISVGPERSLKYFNPFTKVRGEFPTDFGICRFSSIGFSTYPTSPDCVTVAIVDQHVAVEINYVRCGDVWDSFEFRYEDVDFAFRPGTSSPVYIGGTFYILDKIGYLGAFALVDGKESWRVYDRPQTQYSDFHSAHLVSSGGRLHAVFISYMGKGIEVFKFNIFKENWCKVRSLENYCFFISHTSSFSVETTDVGMRNRIYLSRLKGNGILFFSLETGKYHVFGSEEYMENFYGSKEPMQCCWL